MATELGLGAKCMRVLFILFNFLFLLIGLVIMSVGAWLYSTGSTLSYVTGNNYANGAAIIIATGIFTAVLCGIGVLAAILKHKILLGVYIGILVLIIIAEIVAGILGFVYLNNVNSILQSRLQGLIASSDPKSASLVDAIQKELQCCGINSYTDYLNNSFFCANCGLPSGCNCTAAGANCTLFTNNASTLCSGNCSSSASTTYNVYSTGCLNAWSTNSLAMKITYIVGGFGIAVGLFEIIGILVACGLICCIASSEKYTLV